jgi:hypothetical protein
MPAGLNVSSGGLEGQLIRNVSTAAVVIAMTMMRMNCVYHTSADPCSYRPVAGTIHVIGKRLSFPQSSHPCCNLTLSIFLVLKAFRPAASSPHISLFPREYILEICVWIMFCGVLHVVVVLVPCCCHALAASIVEPNHSFCDANPMLQPQHGKIKVHRNNVSGYHRLDVRAQHACVCRR